MSQHNVESFIIYNQTDNMKQETFSHVQKIIYKSLVESVVTEEKYNTKINIHSP